MNICVYGASSNAIDKKYIEVTEELGRRMAERGHNLVFGGGAGGLMGAVVRGVYEKGGYIVGVAPTFFNVDGILFENCNEMIRTETMRQRKQIMEDRADAFIMTPGGMGTFEEFFEVLTLKQLRRHSKPIIVYNVKGYYNPMIAMMNNAVEEKFMTDDCNRLYTVANTEEEVFAQLENYVSYSYNKYNYLEEDNNG